MALFSCSAAFRKSGIHQDGDDVSLRHHVIEQLSRFAANSSMRKLMPVMLPPGRFKLGGLVAIIFVTAINPGVTMKMGNFIMALAAVALGLTPARTAAETIPPQLIGHSVVVKWTADRQTRAAGQVHNNRTAFEINLYISTAGRTFSRWHVLGHDGQGHSDQGPGESRGSSGMNLVVHFEEGALLADRQLGGGAERVTIRFGSNYRSCSAKVITGREQGGSGSITIRSMVRGNVFEVLSVHNSVPSCSIASGNLFGGQ